MQSNNSILAGDPIPKLATSKSTVSPQALEKFVNFLPEGKRNTVDFANELGKRGYWGASDMYKGAANTQQQFAADNRANPNAASQNYNGNRTNSMLWHQELLQDVLGTAKKLGMKDKNTMLANKDLLINNSRFGKSNFDAIMNQPASSNESRGDNFWKVTSGLYDDLNKKEDLQKNLSQLSSLGVASK